MTRPAPRVGLVAACDDPALFNFPLWPKQREVLAAIEERPRMHVLALGRRSGKTTLAALVALWSCLLRPDLRQSLRAGERGYAVCIATNLRQARLLVSAASSILHASPLLAPFIESESEDEIAFTNGMAVAAFACTSRGGRGWPIHTLVTDELAHFLDNEGNLAAESVTRALIPSTAQFGDLARVLATSTPWGSDGHFAELYSKAENGELPDAHAYHATTADVNPTIDAAWLEAEERRDPESFKSEYLAQFVGSGGAFFDPENLAACVSLERELEPGDADGWIAGLDPAFSSDPFALVLIGRAKEDKRRLVVGRVRAWEPPRRSAVTFEEQRIIEDHVLAEVATILRHYGARAVTDQYRAAGVVERLARHGLVVAVHPMSAPTKDAAYGFLRARVNEGSIELPDHPQLLRELRAIRTRYSAGRSSVILPRIGSSHCDQAQALAIAVYEHDRRGIGPQPGRFASLKHGTRLPKPSPFGADHALTEALRR